MMYLDHARTVGYAQVLSVGYLHDGKFHSTVYMMVGNSLLLFPNYPSSSYLTYLLPK